MVQTEVRKAMTYIESKNGLKELSAEYTEDSLQSRFSGLIDQLAGELQDYAARAEELEQTELATDWNTPDKEKPLLAQKILAEVSEMKRMREAAQKKYDSAVMYENWLNEYGNEFAQLYRIKDSHEQRGYSENLEIREIDITDNGDVLTNDKYNKMNAYAPEPLTELVLHVTSGDEDAEDEASEPFGFNFGVMEFNQPNMPPQVKVQLSFDNETLDNLDEIKLKRVFAFCDSHGIPVSDLQIRHFDGSLAEDLIREKIEQFLEKAQKELENKNRLENKNQKAKEDARHQELETERQQLLTVNPDKADELSWEKGEITSDVVPEHRIMRAEIGPAPLAREFVKQSGMLETDRGNTLAERRLDGKNEILSSNVDEISAPDAKQSAVQTISQGVAASEVVPAKDMTHEIIEKAKESARIAEANTQTAKENISVANTQEAPSVEQSASVSQDSRHQRSSRATPPPPMPKIKMSKVEDSFEKLFEKGWGKKSKLSYFKEHTGWFGSGWTVYTFYDTEDPDNRKKDGMEQKDKSVKYTYSFKLFLRMENDGVHFSYRTPNHRKIDQDYISDIVAKLGDLGYTHINFPAGLTNAEKGMWRKAMAENNIVPLNLGLNVKHANTMIEDMKKTEKYDAKTIAEYGLNLANEMKRADEKDHKIPNQARRIFIDGLINTHRYFAFTNAYNEVLKTRVENMLRQPNPQTGSPDKFAAYLTLRKVFDVYKYALENGNSLLNVPEKIKVVTDANSGAAETITLLTAEEKRQIRDMGLGGDVQKMSYQQMDQLFSILYTRQSKEEYEKFKNLLWIQAFAPDRGAKLAPNVVFSNELGFTQNEVKDIKRELTKLGVKDYSPLDDTKLRMEFERFFAVEKPALEKRQAQNHSRVSSQSNRQISSQQERNDVDATQDKAENLNKRTSERKKIIVRRVKGNEAEQPAETKSAAEASAKVDVSQVMAKNKGANSL